MDSESTNSSRRERNDRVRKKGGGYKMANDHLQLLPELLTSFSVLVHKDAHATLPTDELTEPILPNLNLPVAPSEHVRPLLAGVHLTDMHPLRPGAGVGHDDGAAEAAVPRAVAHEAQARRVVEVVGLLAVGVELAREGELGQRAAARGREGLLLALRVDAVQVAIPDAGVARVAEEDEGVGEGLEPVCDRGLERLVRLCVVVHHQCLWEMGL